MLNLRNFFIFHSWHGMAGRFVVNIYQGGEMWEVSPWDCDYSCWTFQHVFVIIVKFDFRLLRWDEFARCDDTSWAAAAFYDSIHFASTTWSYIESTKTLAPSLCAPMLLWAPALMISRWSHRDAGVARYSIRCARVRVFWMFSHLVHNGKTNILLECLEKFCLARAKLASRHDF